MGNRRDIVGNRLRQIASSRGLSLGLIMCNIAADYIVQASVNNAAREENLEGDSCDFALGTGLCFCTQVIGSMSGSLLEFTGKMQDSADGNLWEDIPGAVFSLVTSSNNLQTISFNRRARYVRHFSNFNGISQIAALTVIVGQKRA